MNDTQPTSTRGRVVVLHVRTISGVGGGPDKTILLSVANGAEDHQMAAAFIHPSGDRGFDIVRRRAEELGCRVLGVPDRGPLDLHVLQTLLRICRSLDVRVWHGHEYKSNLIGLLLRPFHRMKLVSTVHGWVAHTPRTTLYYALDRWCLRHYDQVLCVSDDLYERVGRLGVAAGRRTLLPNAVDTGMFARQGSAAAAPLRRVADVPAQRLVVGAVGRLSAEKGFEHLIEASVSLLARGLDFEVWLVGEGGRRADLARLADARGQGRIKLLGYRYDMVEIYQALDLLVSSSLREGLPNVVLEALATGVPVVATRVGGVPSLLEDGRSGLLCPAGDAVALAATMEHALSDGGLRERLARAGRALVEQQYSFTSRAARERAIYDRLLGMSSPLPDARSSTTAGSDG